MNNTTNTITPETRRMFMEDANAILAHDKKNLERRAAAEAILRLLNALKASEDEVAQLRKERDWLANVLAELHDTSLILVDGAPEGSNRPPYWKEAARKAVADESEVKG